ncbi:MAG: hypothetical protein CSB48_00060 [Proteobacteria bacterium]|nr:MAG: hypothetical protein CSB48_00060 [Pseudomonadota bacterium]
MEYDHRHHLYIGIFGILDGYLSLNYQDKSKAQQVLNRGTIQHLYPHIKQAIKLSWKVEQNHSHNEAIDYTLQHYPIPLMAVDDRYRLVVKNRAAGQLTTNSTIGPHQNRKPLLDTNNRQQMDESLWHKAICKYVERHTRDQPADNKRVELKINNTNHPVLISPSSGSASFFKRSPHRQLYWLYFFNDNLFEQIDTMQLSEQAGFTAAESDVALLLARGFTLAEIAESRKVSLETIKKQRNSIFRKTRCDTQEQLLIFLFEQVIYTLSSRTN